MNPYRKAAIILATFVYLVICLLSPLWNNLFLSFIGENVSATTHRIYQNVEEERLFAAIRRGDAASLIEIFSEDEIPNIEATYQIQGCFSSSAGLTVLHEAVGQPEMLQFLLKQGADIDMADERETTPLMFAAIMGELESMEVLLKHGANPHLKNAQGRTAADILDTYKKETNEKTAKKRKWKKQYEKVKGILNQMQVNE